MVVKLRAPVRRCAFLALTLASVLSGGRVIVDIPSHVASTNDCVSRDGTVFAACASTAYASNSAGGWHETFLSPGTFNGGPSQEPSTENFASDFTNWNFDSSWTLKNGGPLDITFHVTTFRALAEHELGGLEINVLLESYNQAPGGPTLDQLVWSHAVYMNYTPGFGPTERPPQKTLDTATFNNVPNCTSLPQTGNASNTTASDIGTSPSGAWCGPIYPFQYFNKMFYDRPMGPWPDASFRAIALLSTVTFVTDANGNVIEKDLTVYDGISYGYDQTSSVDSPMPEPATTWLVGAAAAGLGYFSRRRRTAVQLPRD